MWFIDLCNHVAWVVQILRIWSIWRHSKKWHHDKQKYQFRHRQTISITWGQHFYFLFHPALLISLLTLLPAPLAEGCIGLWCVLSAVGEGFPASPTDKPQGLTRLKHKTWLPLCSLYHSDVAVNWLCECERMCLGKMLFKHVCRWHLWSSQISYHSGPIRSSILTQLDGLCQRFFFRTEQWRIRKRAFLKLNFMVTKGCHRPVFTGSRPRVTQIRWFKPKSFISTGAWSTGQQYSMLGKLQHRGERCTVLIFNHCWVFTDYKQHSCLCRFENESNCSPQRNQSIEVQLLSQEDYLPTTMSQFHPLNLWPCCVKRRIYNLSRPQDWP